ncbi:MAG TPA: 3-hydroxyacyl-CoA dehydrogenase/enoyl-CoA hydratase family protein [Rubricoccaceae bacterium]|nr:3-hydroxyacyl-CoA dehydrogenase/enoyl-CoA hydratase family protein [Rubricoccaceae bacterium]
METPTLSRPRTDGAPASAQARKPFRTAAVLGAGVMGSQIAAHLANAGLQVHLLDVTPAQLGREGKPDDIVEGAFKAATKLSPDPFFSESVQRRITLGNFDEDFDRVAEADWVIEVVVEKLDVKRELMARVEAAAREDAVISSNTSGLPIHEIAEGRSEAFRRRFLGTHFFNPPRYLKLFEVIPTDDTDPEVVARVSHFARVHLGKGVVVAKDTPNFIGNRIGIYGIMGAVRQFTEGGYSIEEIDQLTGTLVGHPKSATFRTADVVGLDTLVHVTQNLYEGVPEDESREAFRVPDVLARLVELKRLGQKSGAGFYKKVGKDILSLDPATMEYAAPAESDLDVSDIKRAGDLPARLNALYEDDGRAGSFFRATTLDLLAYAARRIPEIADSPADVDRAVKWGFGWELGPFETWDALGFARVRDRMAEEGLALPGWVDEVPAEGFYREEAGERQVWVPGEGYRPDPRPADEWGLAVIKRQEGRTLWKSSEAALLDIGDGVALFEFRSKANALGQELMQGLRDAIERVENDADLRGMVIGNEGNNFSVGANLAEMVMAMAMGQTEVIGDFLKGFQDTILRVRYAEKPVVVAAHQRVLGGGCEMVLACPHPVAAAETYLGLVELGVGLIPSGCGTMIMTAKAAEAAANRDRPSEIQPFLRKHFEQIAMAKVATSALMAQEMGYLPPEAVIVMNDARRFHVAKQEVVRLSEEGYLPPPPRTAIPVLGAPGRAQFEVALYQYEWGNYVSEYDHFLASKLAWVMTGGDLTAPAEVHEQYLLDLEREAFLSLLGEEKTQARIQSILTTNKPLRN